MNLPPHPFRSPQWGPNGGEGGPAVAGSGEGAVHGLACAIEPSVPRGGTDAETQRRAVVASSLSGPKVYQAVLSLDSQIH